jgi:Dyp-type peroxidase family
MTGIDHANVQGDILRAYGSAYDRTSYVFVRVTDARRGREWLGGLVDRVTTAEPWTAGKPSTTLNVALTCAGLAALGLPDAAVGSFSREYREGMAARARQLGDTGAGDPAGWDAGLGTGEAHVLLTVNALPGAALDAELDAIRDAIAGAALEVVREEGTQILGDAREHFGFADGFAQPALEGVHDGRTRGGGVPEAGGDWRPLAPGEFILGYPDEESRDDPRGGLPSAPSEPLGRGGTYMVWRKLRQDVALFRRTLRDAARLYEDGDEAKLAAKVVGRWRNGSPLVTSPEEPHPDFDATAPGANDFRYDDVDPDGLRCPLGAHIRRSNPRAALGFDGRLSFRHRLIRRGMPYGPPLPGGVTEDDGQDRGLVFVCFNASIARQFEAVQLQWLGDGNVFGLGHDRDFLLGDARGTGKMTVQGRPPFFLAPQGPFVTTRGGEYLYVPPITGLAAIADGSAG